MKVIPIDAKRKIIEVAVMTCFDSELEPGGAVAAMPGLSPKSRRLLRHCVPYSCLGRHCCCSHSTARC